MIPLFSTTGLFVMNRVVNSESISATWITTASHLEMLRVKVFASGGRVFILYLTYTNICFKEDASIFLC